MWIEKTANNKYKYVDRYLDPRTRKLKKVSVTLDGNKRADRKAAEEALRLRVAVLTALPNSARGMTLKALTEKYRDYQRENLKKQTAINTHRKLDVLTRKLGEGTLVTALTAPYIRECLKDDKPVTYNERIKHLKAMMRWAYREEIVDDISFIDRLPYKKTDPVRIKDKFKYLERDELRMVLDGMKVEHWRLLTEFLALSGLRIGEAIALTKKDIDLKHRIIHVEKTLSLVTMELSSTKTDMSFREVYIQDELLSCVRKILAFSRKFHDKQFFTIGDGYISYSTYAVYLKENTKRIIGRPLSPHALRHTHVALLAEAGIPLDAISRRLGHADSDITKDIYFHVTKKVIEEENKRIKGIKIL